jgi:prevent-host-death family protein
MQTINIHKAKTHLSRLVEEAAKGEPFIIAKAGKPMVKVVPLDPPAPKKVRRLGFMEGMYNVPDDIKSPYKDEIEEMFYGNPGKFDRQTGEND